MSHLNRWLLNGVYAALMVVASPWIIWSALRHGKYREGFSAKLLGRVPQRAESIRPCVWLHAVSVGEVNLLQTTLAELRRQVPEAEFFISTTTKTGYQLATRKYAEHTVFYCPLDFSWAVRRALQRVRPNLLVLAELELWPNLIQAASARGTKIAVINGRLSDKSFRGYRRVRPLVTRLMQRLDLVAAQNEETADRFRQLGARRVTVTGSLKFDGARTNRDNPRTQALRELASLSQDDIVLIAGSTQSPEEQYAMEIFRALAPANPRLRLILVPRHPERFDEVAKQLDRLELPWVRRSNLPGSPASTIRSPQSVILVDTIGELGDWWGVASIGFVGGSFGSRGGQNMLEPAAYGVATCFGPNTRNFRDIVGQLLRAEAAQVVQDREELARFVEHALADPDWAKALGNRAKELVLSQQGATQRTVEHLVDLLDSQTHARSAEAA